MSPSIETTSPSQRRNSRERISRSTCAYDSLMPVIVATTALRPTSPSSFTAFRASNAGNSSIRRSQKAGSKKSLTTICRNGCADANSRRRASDRLRTAGLSIRSRAGPLLAGGALRQLVAAIIIVVRRVALGPDPLDAMFPGELIELLPEVPIQNGLLRGGHPVLLLPAVDPCRDSVLHVFGIGDDLDFTR